MIADIIIVGSGLTGLLTAASLLKLGKKILIIDKKPPFISRKLDIRALTISAKSKEILKKFGIWQDIAPHVGKINKIKITEDNLDSFLNFDYPEPMGYVIENHLIGNAIYEKLRKSELITFYDNSEIEVVENNYDWAVIKANGQIIKTKMLIAADGKFSELRKFCSIPLQQKDFNQNALVFKIEHQFTHQETAYEFFLKQGPFATLPLKAANNSGVVWTLPKNSSGTVSKLKLEDLNFFLNQKTQNLLGNCNIISEIISYPLTMILVKNYYHNRILFIGDAAHSIHPIAGQGFNLTIKDIDILNNCLTKNLNIGLELGNLKIYQEYQKQAQISNMAMAAITSNLNKIFLENFLPIKIVRKIGLKFLENVPLSKNFFIEYAMGYKTKFF